MKRDLKFFLKDILENINRIEEFSKDINKKELMENKQK